MADKINQNGLRIQIMGITGSGVTASSSGSGIRRSPWLHQQDQVYSGGTGRERYQLVVRYRCGHPGGRGSMESSA